MLVVVDDAVGPVAGVPICINTETRCGAFGAMEVSTDGAPRQRVRAMVLLVREALRFAAEQGIVTVETPTPPRMVAFASRLTGLTPEQMGAGFHFRGDLARIRTRTLEESDANGDFRS